MDPCAFLNKESNYSQTLTIIIYKSLCSLQNNRCAKQVSLNGRIARNKVLFTSIFLNGDLKRVHSKRSAINISRSDRDCSADWTARLIRMWD